MGTVSAVARGANNFLKTLHTVSQLKPESSSTAPASDSTMSLKLCAHKKKSHEFQNFDEADFLHKLALQN
jgi:hypothetical protein